MTGSIATPEARFDAWWALRQRKMARLRCAAGHFMVVRHSAHLGTWFICAKCGFTE